MIAIPLFPDDRFEPGQQADFAQAKRWFLRAVSLSRVGVVKTLWALGVPEGGKKSPLRQNCHAWVIDTGGRWMEDTTVRRDDDLGVVYEAQEAE